LLFYGDFWREVARKLVVFPGQSRVDLIIRPGQLNPGAFYVAKSHFGRIFKKPAKGHTFRSCGTHSGWNNTELRDSVRAGSSETDGRVTIGGDKRPFA